MAGSGWQLRDQVKYVVVVVGSMTTTQETIREMSHTSQQLPTTFLLLILLWYLRGWTMARYWSMPMRRVERRITVETRVATKVRTQQKEAVSKREDAVWSNKLKGVKRRREKRFDTARLRTNLWKKEKKKLVIWAEYYAVYDIDQMIKISSILLWLKKLDLCSPWRSSWVSGRHSLHD